MNDIHVVPAELISHKWDSLSESLNLKTSLTIINQLLSTTELNMDDMEPDTYALVECAEKFLDEAHKAAYFPGR